MKRPVPSVTPCEMSGDCFSIAVRTAHVSQSKPMAESVYPISLMVLRTTTGMSTHALVVISPATTAMPVFTRVSHATRAVGSFSRIPSRMASEI